MILKGQKAIITGGTAGIGKAIALRFAKAGAHVAIFGTSHERGAKVVEEINACSEHKAIFFAVDVSKTDEVNKAVGQVLESFGALDILVNNAGITKDNLLMRMTEEDWDRVIDVNLKSVFNLCKAAVKPMMKARRGKILNISSIVGLTGNAGQVNYAASKSGIIGVTKSLAKELASRNIHVNCIAPGFIGTSMTESLKDTIKDELIKNIPMKRMGNPDEIAQAALFLASDAANYVTGQVLAVDGGLTM